MEFIKNFIQEEDGVTAIEYGLMAALIAVAIIAGATLLGTSLSDLFSKIGACVASPKASNTSCTF